VPEGLIDVLEQVEILELDQSKCVGRLTSGGDLVRAVRIAETDGMMEQMHSTIQCKVLRA